MAHREYLLIHGSRAWSRIKATAAEQRELWRDVGEALLVGRRMHKSNQAFSQWLKETGFAEIASLFIAVSAHQTSAESLFGT